MSTGTLNGPSSAVPHAEELHPHDPRRMSVPDRLIYLAERLLGGMLPPEFVDGAMGMWRVSKRTAQLYVQRAAEQLAAETDPGNQVFLLRVGQLARTRLFQKLDDIVRHSEQYDPKQAKTIIQAALAGLKVLDSRDRTAFKLLASDAELPPAKLEGSWGDEDEHELEEATDRPHVRCAKPVAAVSQSPVDSVCHCLPAQELPSPDQLTSTGPDLSATPGDNADSSTSCAAAPAIAQAGGESPKSMSSNGLARKPQPAPDCAHCAVPSAFPLSGGSPHPATGRSSR